MTDHYTRAAACIVKKPYCRNQGARCCGHDFDSLRVRKINSRVGYILPLTTCVCSHLDFFAGLRKCLCCAVVVLQGCPRSLISVLVEIACATLCGGQHRYLSHPLS